MSAFSPNGSWVVYFIPVLKGEAFKRKRSLYSDEKLVENVIKIVPSVITIHTIKGTLNKNNKYYELSLRMFNETCKISTPDSIAKKKCKAEFIKLSGKNANKFLFTFNKQWVKNIEDGLI